MDKATKERLSTGGRALGVVLDEAQLAKLAEYLALLQTWNRKINLTAITEERTVVELHFLDSLAVTPLMRGCATLIDVGSGAGFPGAVLAIALPALAVTCIDAVAKKVAFLQTLKRTVAPNLEPLHKRDEQLDRTFDAAVSRATWDPPEWIEHGARLVHTRGLVIAMQTADAPVLEAPVGFTREPPIVYSVGSAARRLQPFRRNA
ncbi:MAG TPA: 16S rRNA (guanine(527)-N(7))-methyltransferase RsmG [Polyangia bacterium]|nr:16S rRNA (guanine(527)-N(7))-methyltransferase RsmG [Polyangia bacterium]